MMDIRVFACLVLCVTLTGCASRTFYNHNIDQSYVQNQFVIDNGYCVQVMEGALAMPSIRVYQPAYSGVYQVTGYSAASGPYSATVTQTASNTDAFTAGFANGWEMGNAMNASKNRRSIFDGCMYSLGWTLDQNAPISE